MTDSVRLQIGKRWQEQFDRLNRGEPGITGLMSFGEAWEIVVSDIYPKPLQDASGPKQTIPGDHLEAWKMVIDAKKLPALLSKFQADLKVNFHYIEREIKHYMSAYEKSSDLKVIGQLVVRIRQWHDAWHPRSSVGSTIASTFKSTFVTCLVACLPPAFLHGLKALASLAFSFGPQALNIDHSFWNSMQALGLLERYESLITAAANEVTEKHVLETCKAVWDRPMLKELKEWQKDVVKAWLVLFSTEGGSKNDAYTVAKARNLELKFDFHLHQTLCDLRIKEIFDIIIDYPDSLGALEDLNTCVRHLDVSSSLIKTLRAANQKRLLHPGADTKLILTQYVATIKCLRIIDPAGVLLYKVADPIRRYLRDRPDTIRCIVASLIGDSESGDSLVDDSEPIVPLYQALDEDFMDQGWEPDPYDAGPDFRANKTSDIISTLVSIYDSKDLFIKELQGLLAQRLLAITDGDFDNELRNIELLKIRFGEAALQPCEVMMKDMIDSRRVDQHVQSQKPIQLHPTIISKNFWPALGSGDIKMPGQLRALQEKYEQEFHIFKPDKRLKWFPHLGTVDIELELADRTVREKVPPLEAAFIELFSEKASWTIDALISRVGTVDRSAALKALRTWVKLGVLKPEGESDQQYALLEYAEGDGGAAVDMRQRPVVAEEPVTVSVAEQQQAEQLRVYWKFIQGMLTNLGGLSLDRIQNMLKFAPGYDRTVDQLAAFMQAAEREGLVTVRDGVWKLR